MKTELDPTRSAPTGANAPQPRWLVVDDMPDILELMAVLLGRIGAAEICRANSGAEALALFTATPEAFTFVVTDFEMPGMNGAELCRRLHALAPKLPILLATGSALMTTEAAQELGFCGILFKPFPPLELTRAVAAAGVLAAGKKISNRAAALVA